MAETNEIKKYLKENIDKGFEEKELVKHLIKTGVSKEEVTQAENELKEETVSTISTKPYTKMFLITGVILVAVALIYGSISLIGTATDCGYDKQCFIQQANRCNKAIVRENLAGTIVKYTTNNCVLTKNMEQVAENEPEQVKLLFQGKSMTCPYSQNSFNPFLVESIITSLDTCSGDLKTVLNEISIVQYELGV